MLWRHPLVTPIYTYSLRVALFETPVWDTDCYPLLARACAFSKQPWALRQSAK